MEYENIPLGLALGLASNTQASAAYGEMSDFERQLVITEAETITNKVRMDDLVSRIANNRSDVERKAFSTIDLESANSGQGYKNDRFY